MILICKRADDHDLASFYHKHAIEINEILVMGMDSPAGLSLFLPNLRMCTISPK